MSRISLLGLASLTLAGLMMPGAAFAALHVVRDGEQIQTAFDAASPGDTIYVRRGTYTGTAGNHAVAWTSKSDITLIGSRGAVIDATGFEYGLMIGDDAPINSDGCPPFSTENFRMFGFTIKNAGHTGLKMIGVDGFELSYGRYIDNYKYGPFPICSRDGLIKGNFASGHNDAAIYVGDDQNIKVKWNRATDNVVAVEIENSLDCEVSHNWLYGNAGGLLVFVGPNLPMPFTESVRVSRNWIVRNNRENTGSGAIAGVPEGTGILVFGSDTVTIDRNFVVANDSFGLAVIGNFNVFLDPRIEPFNDNLVVKRNRFFRNGENVDALRSFTPGADIVFLPDVFDPGPITGTPGTLLLSDPDPSDNCFSNNKFTSDFPPGIIDSFPCP